MIASPLFHEIICLKKPVPVSSTVTDTEDVLSCFKFIGQCCRYEFQHFHYI